LSSGYRKRISYDANAVDPETYDGRHDPDRRRARSRLLESRPAHAGAGPQGRAVCFERNYLWEGEQGADIRVEVTVYEPKSFEEGVRLTRSIRRETG
jgi:hypothetical protein